MVTTISNEPFQRMIKRLETAGYRVVHSLPIGWTFGSESGFAINDGEQTHLVIYYYPGIVGSEPSHISYRNLQRTNNARFARRDNEPQYMTPDQIVQDMPILVSLWDDSNPIILAGERAGFYFRDLR